MKSVELFVALGFATTISLSGNGTVNAIESEVEMVEGSTNSQAHVIAEGGGEGGEASMQESTEGGEGGEGS